MNLDHHTRRIWLSSRRTTQRLLNELGRHGQRPAHVHFFVSARDIVHLTTQIDIAGDSTLTTTSLFATREGLIPKSPARRHKKMKEKELNTPFSEIEFELHPDRYCEGKMPKTWFVGRRVEAA